LSLKNDIEMVKEELSSEEKFFEKAVVTERFVKKYKKLMIGSVIAVALFVAGNIAYDINKQNTITAANKALSELQKNPSDVLALERLETLSPALHDVWLYSQAIAKQDVKALEKLTNSNAMMIGDLSTYEVAQNLQDEKKLEDYVLEQNAIYRDLAFVQIALIEMNNGNIDDAHDKLKMISVDSPLAQVARALMHYGVK
jgi:hypothetical protein